MALMENSDKSLIDAHLQGDSTAFGVLVRRYGDNLLSYLTRISGSRELAEDLFQETFKRVHEKAHKFRGSRFKGWLYKIATNVAIDCIRRIRRVRVVSLERRDDCDGENFNVSNAFAATDVSYEPLREAIKTENQEKVRRAIELLPDRQRATLVLAYYQQLSYPQVAEVLGCSTGTVKTQMYRALRTLAERLPEISESIE
jgi:RNA polymerase sigma-70 factor (ECF subfamily)